MEISKSAEDVESLITEEIIEKNMKNEKIQKSESIYAVLGSDVHQDL